MESGHRVDIRYVAYFRHEYDDEHADLRRQVCKRIVEDGARHMGFGMPSLPAVVAEASATERREMEVFPVWALNHNLRGISLAAA